MLEKYVFPYIRKWCVVGGLCLAFPWVAYAQATENLVKHSECYIETSDGADKGASCCKCGI